MSDNAPSDATPSDATLSDTVPSGTVSGDHPAGDAVPSDTVPSETAPRQEGRRQEASGQGAPSRGAQRSSSALPEAWKVDLPVFQGPLDLLLQLTKVNKVEISDIPVALVCDQFHEYLSLMDELNLDIAGEYIYEAAMLIHLKSRLLLPRSSSEAEVEEDPREDLVRRLLEYRRLKEAAQSLAETHAVRRGIWTRNVDLRSLGLHDQETVDLSDVSLHTLLGALKQVLGRYDRDHPDPLLLEREVFSVRDQFDRLLANLSASRPFDLLEDLRRCRTRGEVVAAFLAVLELARLHLVRLHQTDVGEVLLYRTTKEPTADELEAISR